MGTQQRPAPRVWQELRTIRTLNGDSLTSLARRADNMSLGYLSDLESGKREPNARVTKSLAEALKVPVSVLEKDNDDAARIIEKLAIALNVPASTIEAAIESHLAVPAVTG